METEVIIGNLSNADKICLFNALYTDLAGQGIEGDTELAHVNTEEMAVLRAMGGSGTVNPNTGLIQFGGGGSPPPPPPATQSVTQQTEFPSELKPYISDVLSKAQAIQKKREAEGYIPYEGPQIAEFTPEQEKAFTGIEGMVGAGQQYFDPATRLAASSAFAPRPEEVQQYMSPYMQQVVDIQQREAKRQADVAAQQLGAQAVGAGGFGGSRQAILEAEQQRNLQTQLGDIQARGLAAAYEDAQARLAAQRQRELAASGQFAMLGQVAPQQQIKELTALEAIGAQRQAQQQQALDIAKSQFQQEQLFPEQTLQQYQSVIRGFPLAPTTYETRQTTTPAPSYLQQAAGLGGLALGAAGAMGAFKAKGGKVDSKNGLGSIVVKRQAGSQIGGMQFGGQQFGGRRYGGYDPRLKDYTYSPENVEEYKKNLRERIAEKEAILEASGIEQREKMRLDEERRKRISQLEMQRPGLFSELFTQTKDKPALEQQRQDIEAELSMLRNQTSPALERDKQDIEEGTALRSPPLRPKTSPVVMDMAKAEDDSMQSGLEQFAPQPIMDMAKAEDDSMQTGLEGLSPITGKGQEAKSTIDNIFDQYKKDLGLAKDKLSEFNKIKKGILEKQQKGLDTQRWWSVAKLGAEILRQPGGQTVFEAIGKGVTDSKLIDRLASLDDKQQEMALNIAQLDKETMVEQLGLTAKQADIVIKERDMARQDLLANFEGMKARAAIRKALMGDILDDKEVANVASDLQKLADAGSYKTLETYAKNTRDPRTRELAKAFLLDRTATAPGRTGDSKAPGRGAAAANVPSITPR